MCPVNFSNEKYIREKWNKKLDIFLWKKRYQVFVNYSLILPIWQILFLFSCFWINKLFLFLFVQKFASQIYSYSNLRGKLLFTDHWRTTSLNRSIRLFHMLHRSPKGGREARMSAPRWPEEEGREERPGAWSTSIGDMKRWSSQEAFWSVRAASRGWTTPWRQ